MGKNGLYGVVNSVADCKDGNISDKSIAEYIANMQNIEEEEEMEKIKNSEE